MSYAEVWPLLQRPTNRSTTELVAALLGDSQPAAPNHVDLEALDQLPPPVARYFRHVLPDRRPVIRVARLEQVGTLRTNLRSRRWSSFTARQIVVPASPGFVWDARVTILPLLYLRVRDAYVGGSGSGRVSVFPGITLAADSARPELDSGALHRYLAEGAWYPTALLPGPALHWSPLSSAKAVATLSDAGLTVSLEFWFNHAGEITGVYSPGRWGRFNGGYQQTPWEGHFRNYQERDGMLIPSVGEVGWYSRGEWECVWKGRTVKVDYESPHS
jgi:hypothetical protein